jgi:hypothetical protein
MNSGAAGHYDVTGASMSGSTDHRKPQSFFEGVILSVFYFNCFFIVCFSIYNMFIVIYEQAGDYAFIFKINDYLLDYLIFKLVFNRGFAPKTLLTFLS